MSDTIDFMNNNFSNEFLSFSKFEISSLSKASFLGYKNKITMSIIRPNSLMALNSYAERFDSIVISKSSFNLVISISFKAQ